MVNPVEAILQRSARKEAQRQSERLDQEDRDRNLRRLADSSERLSSNMDAEARIARAVEYVDDLDRHGSIDHTAAQEIKRRLGV